MHFIVVDDRGRLIAGACSSPDVARLVALLEDEPAAIRSLEDPTMGEQPRPCALPRGWRVVESDEVDPGVGIENCDEACEALGVDLSASTTDGR